MKKIVLKMKINQQFLQDNPDRQSEMMRYQDMARKMVEGGYVRKMSEGGSPEAADALLKKKDILRT